MIFCYDKLDGCPLYFTLRINTLKVNAKDATARLLAC